MEVRNIHKIIKVGNSLAVVLPRVISRTLNMKRGDLVVLGCVQENVVYIRKINEQDVRNDDIEIINFNK